MTDATLAALERMAEKSLAMADRIEHQPDCRTCMFYLQEQHACRLFFKSGSLECIDGSHWTASKFIPVWRAQ